MIQVKRYLIVQFLALVLLLVTGCVTNERVGDMTVLSTQNVTLDKVDIDSLPTKRGVIGKDERFVFLFIPFGQPRLEDAVDDALYKGNGDILLDPVVYRKGWWFLVGKNKIEVKASVVRTK